MRMRIRHDSGMQLLACAVYIINAFSYSLLLYDLYMLARSALSQPCLQHFTSMHADNNVMEDNQTECSRGRAKWASCLYIIPKLMLILSVEQGLWFFISEQKVVTGNDVILMIDFHLFSFLPTDPTSFSWCSVEWRINLVWPNEHNRLRPSHHHKQANVLSPCIPTFLSAWLTTHSQTSWWFMCLWE